MAQEIEDTTATGLTLADARAELLGIEPMSQKRDTGLPASSGDDRMTQRMMEEFPQHASELIDPVSRRGFMKLMGASLALAGVTGCTKQPDEPIYPYVKQPEDLVLGKRFISRRRSRSPLARFRCW